MCSPYTFVLINVQNSVFKHVEHQVCMYVIFFLNVQCTLCMTIYSLTTRRKEKLSIASQDGTKRRRSDPVRRRIKCSFINIILFCVLFWLRWQNFTSWAFSQSPCILRLPANLRPVVKSRKNALEKKI